MSAITDRILRNAPHLMPAWERARTRSMCQSLGIDPDDSDVPSGTCFIVRPDELLPYEQLAVVSLGRKLARKYGWYARGVLAGEEK